MSISPLSPMHDMAAVPLAQAKGPAAERAAHSADARARLVEGQRRSDAAAALDGAAGDNDVPDDRESAERPPWQASHQSTPRDTVPDASGDQPDRALGGSLDLTA
ncbi:MAG TPA: hypothetical protein VHD36_04600 [Pirellulales bacterium]|nr:hypothetical protein [Pirellulales bacterium]